MERAQHLLESAGAFAAAVVFLGLAFPGTPVAGTSGPLVGVPDAVDPTTLFHTLATDFFVQNDGTIYVQTGDIPAMWLRDSAAQTLPYVRLAASRPMLRTWIRAVIAREARNIEVDPYANAFRANYRVWERKWEVDSLGSITCSRGSSRRTTANGTTPSVRITTSRPRTEASSGAPRPKSA